MVFSADGDRLRYLSEEHIAELNLHYFDRHIDANLAFRLERLIPDLLDEWGYEETKDLLARFRESHPEVYRTAQAKLVKYRSQQVKPRPRGSMNDRLPLKHHPTRPLF